MNLFCTRPSYKIYRWRQNTKTAWLLNILLYGYEYYDDFFFKYKILIVQNVKRLNNNH